MGWLRGCAFCRRFLQGFGEDVAVAGSESDAAEGGESWSDIGGRDGLEILAGLDAEAHQQNRDVLIVVVGHAVAGAVGARLSRRGGIEKPVRFWQDEEVAATSGKITIGEGAKRRALRGGPVLEFFSSVNGGDARLVQRGVQDGLHRSRIVLQFVIDAGRKVNIAAADTRDGGLWILEGREGLFDSFLQLQ